MTAKRRDDASFCSFCGRGRDEAPQMISSPTGVYICADCVDVCNRMVSSGGRKGATTETAESANGKGAPKTDIPKLDVPKPAAIKAYQIGRAHV